MPTIAERYAEICERVHAAAARSGRSDRDVRIIAATKTASVDVMRELIAAGCRDLGENRAQELVAKAPELADLAPIWHFIGSLQTNKVGQCAPWVQWWHSVDRPGLVDVLAQRSPGAHVLIEVNLADEVGKAGCALADLEALFAQAQTAGLHVRGLMTVPPVAGDPRRFFAQLRTLADRFALPECSMGMSADYEIAIEEGATMVRIGTALVGPRVVTPH